MNLTFVYKQNKKQQTFQDVASVKKTIPDADIGFLHYVRALTVNLAFRNLINKHRKEFGIPENGFEYKDKDQVVKMLENKNDPSQFEKSYKMLHLYKWKPYQKITIGNSMEEIISYISLFNRVPIILKTHISWNPELNIEDDMAKVFNKMLKPEHRYYTQEEIDNMWRHSPKDALDAYEDKIHSTPYFDIPILSVQINIDSPLSLYFLTKYLKKNWEDIEYYLLKMDSYNIKSRWKSFYISERDIEIVELHRFQGKTFKEIGDLYEERGNFELYEDNIKTAFHRAVKKIDDLLIPEV